MAKLTKRAIDSFRYRGGWDVRWDSAVPGLGVRVYPSGKKAFVLSYRAGRRKRLMVLGRYGVDLTLEQARKKAGKQRSMVGDGVDPLEEKKRAAVGKTVRDLKQLYLARQKARGNKTWREDEKRLDRHLPSRWLSRLAVSLEHHEIVKLHSDVGAQAPYEANRLLACLHRMYALAPGFLVVPKGHPNPAAGVEKFAERKRKRWASVDEVRTLCQEIDRVENVYARHALWLYLLTGVRKSELLRAKRSDIDRERARLRLPDTKSGEEQSVALNTLALAILKATPAAERNPYIFAGAKPKSHFVNIEKPWRGVRNRATVRMWGEYPDPAISGLIAKLRGKLKREPTVDECREAADFELPVGLTDLRLHDLRRTVGSWMSQSAIDINTIKEALRHASISTTLIYARLAADQAREAFEAHGRRLAEVAGGPRLLEISAEKP